MSVERTVFMFTGALVVASVALAWFWSPLWLLLTLLLGLNMLQASLTGWCPLALIFKKMGRKPAGDLFNHDYQLALKGKENPLPDGIQVLALFQEKARLIDFLMEDIDSYDDARIGAAVRTIHRSAKETLIKYFDPRPLRQESESGRVTVEKGFDPLSVRLVGNVRGEPPYNGILNHPGWKAGAINLPPRINSSGCDIIFPAEIEIS